MLDWPPFPIFGHLFSINSPSFPSLFETVPILFFSFIFLNVSLFGSFFLIPPCVTPNFLTLLLYHIHSYFYLGFCLISLSLSLSCLLPAPLPLPTFSEVIVRSPSDSPDLSDRQAVLPPLLQIPLMHYSTGFFHISNLAGNCHHCFVF